MHDSRQSIQVIVSGRLLVSTRRLCSPQQTALLTTSVQSNRFNGSSLLPAPTTTNRGERSRGVWRYRRQTTSVRREPCIGLDQFRPWAAGAGHFGELRIVSSRPLCVSQSLGGPPCAP